MDNKLYTLSDNGLTTQMNQRPYEKEDHLQKLVADNPNLVARVRDDAEDRLFLVKRELQMMESEDSSNSYSLDLLLVGEDAVPVLVEVKRSTDTRIRREVVAQMIDYACRASMLDVETLQSHFQDANGNDVEIATKEFWDKVSVNLRAGRIRLAFVADEIPDTLRMMIEYLDRCMTDVEVYGVEVKQYLNDNASLISSNVVGNSLIEKKTSARLQGRIWDNESFREFLAANGASEVSPVVADLETFALRNGMTCVYGKGAFSPSYTIKSGKKSICNITTRYGNGCAVEISLDSLDSVSKSSAAEQDWYRLPQSENGWEWQRPKYSYINLKALLVTANMEKFKEILRQLCKFNQE